MSPIPHEEWGSRIDDYHFPQRYAEPLKLSFEDWKDPSDPLGSLLEIFKFSKFSPEFGVKPSVTAGQFFLESDMGRSQNAIVGIKASKTDIANGTFKEYPTYEELSEEAVQDLDKAGKLIHVEREVVPGRYLVKCLQKFHYEEGLQDDADLFWRYYERREPTRFQFLKAPPETYLRSVTVGPPWKYATDHDYVGKVMSKIVKYKLAELDCVII
jgi:hypothetical protein